MAEDPVKADEVVPGHRLRAGAAIFVTGQLAPLAIPLVTNSSLPATWKSVLSGVLLLGVPELAIVLTVVVLGKAGFNELKARIWKLVNRTVLPRDVSRGRYYAGLVVFLIPILIGWLLPYLYESAPSLLRYRLTVAIVGDVALIAGLCLLGGQFWDKIRALFVYDARATFPPVSSHDPDETH